MTDDVDTLSPLRVVGLRKRFGDVAAVSGVSFHIAKGERLALLGESGCGKTTLLRMIAGFERPDAGRILVEGRDITDLPPYERPVNMMFQSYALFPHMNVARNVGFGLVQEGVARAEIARRVEEALDLVQMAHLGGRRPDQLSGGQRQRVALARAIVKRPKLLLLDEPMAALDRKLRERTRLELVELQQRLGIAFVIVTHDQDEAMSMASSVAVMDKGGIAQFGTPTSIYEQPASRFVAEFFGGANILEGEARASTLVRCAMLGIDIVTMPTQGIDDGRTIGLAIRPERIALSRDRPEDIDNIAQGEVREVSYLGDRSICHVEMAVGLTMRAAIDTRYGKPRPGPGEKVWLAWTARDTIVLRD
ncbi:MAG: ABC transporter ATP-binding protein [Alphaproteobacteria bacterium]|nr:ABC transporter ATP-binding protein [Alphaproteobacteria bacterium]MCW5739158.1 ABC transporter ATP-binding protein [Alphaproteobacteria bacterium]